MKNKKSVLILIFSLLLTLACPVRVEASYVDDYEYVYAYTVWNYIIIDNYYFIGGTDDELLTYYMDNFYSPYIDIRKRAYLHDSSSLAVVLALEGFSISSYDNSSSSEKMFLDWLEENTSNIPELYTHFSLSITPPIFEPTPMPSNAPSLTPIPTYNPQPTARPTYTPVPLPTSEPLPINDYYLWGNSGGSLGCGSSLPSSFVWATSFSTTLTLNSTFNIPLPNGITLKSSRTDFGILEIGSYTVFTNVFTTYGSSSTTGNLPCIVRSSDYVENLWIGSWSGSVVSPSPMPTNTPVPLPPISTPIPTFNPNAPINPDFDYNLGQAVEFGQLPTLFSNVSKLSYLFVTPFEFLVTNMWERWYILFLFPIVAIISAFIWERRN